MRSESPHLEDLIDRLTDGLDVDWPTAQTQSRDEDEKGFVRALEDLDRIGRAHQPTTWEHLEILEPVAAGAHGEVYRAWDGNLEREVALKLLRPRLPDDSVNLTALEEGRLLAKVKHENVIDVYGALEKDGRVGIWMEYVRGRTLSDILRAQGPLDWKRAALIGVDVCRAIAAVHERKVVHRDIKAQNIMEEAGGRILLVDFGIGHRQDPVGFEPAIAGTPLYAAPELFVEGRATPQTDIYSLGVLLYHLVTADFPVKGNSAREVREAHGRGESILLRDIAPDLPESFVGVVERALAKNPAERFRSAGQMEKALLGALAQPSRKGLGLRAAVAALLASFLAVLVFMFAGSGPEGPGPASVTPTPRPSVAVLLFQNRTGDPSVDWLRLGVADLLVTDLAQSPQLRVVGTDEVYRLLEGDDGVQESVITPELADEVAERTGASTVVQGSFFQAGETLRLSARVQDVTSGEVIASELVEGVGEASLFQMVDELSSRVRAAILVSPQDSPAVDRQVAEVSTVSSEAYRHYVEGVRLQIRGQLRQAIPLFEKAVEIDPGFALAHSKLSLLYMFTGRDETAMEHSRLAVENADRASERERFYIEGNHYSWYESTCGQAIEIYQEALARYPDFALARHNKAILQWNLGEYDYAIQGFEEMRHSRPDFRQAYRPLALSYAARNEFERGRLVLLDLLQTGVNDAYAYVQLGDLLTLWGRADEARQAYESANAASPRTVDLDDSLWRVLLLEEDWSALDAWRQRVEEAESSSPMAHAFEKALISLYRGHGNEAVEILVEAADGSPEVTTDTAAAREMAAHVLLQMGEPRRAIEIAEIARREGAGDITEWDAWFTAAVAHAALGEWEEARRAAEEMESRSAVVPGRFPKIRNHRLAAELALRRGETAAAIAELEKASALLPRRGIVSDFVRRPHHVPLWYAMASARLAEGEDDAAYELLSAIVSSPSERLLWPILYVRSYYRLAEIDARRGDDERARQNFARFLEHWAEGDVDREEVREARGWIH